WRRRPPAPIPGSSANSTTKPWPCTATATSIRLGLLILQPHLTLMRRLGPPWAPAPGLAGGSSREGVPDGILTALRARSPGASAVRAGLIADLAADRVELARPAPGAQGDAQHPVVVEPD